MRSFAEDMLMPLRRGKAKKPESMFDDDQALEMSMIKLYLV